MAGHVSRAALTRGDLVEGTAFRPQPSSRPRPTQVDPLHPEPPVRTRPDSEPGITVAIAGWDRGFVIIRSASMNRRLVRTTSVTAPQEAGDAVNPGALH
jgi:hypothetical protein